MTPVSEADFQLFKAVAVATALVLAMTAQQLAPYRQAGRALIANWKVNFPLACINAAIVAAACGGCACLVAKLAEDHAFGVTTWLGLGAPWRILIGVIALDLTAYLWHRANHHYSLLWRFHAVHHSDVVFDASTALRFHPIEILLALPIRLTIVGLLGVPVLGILAFEIVYAAANLFEHGNLRLPRALELRLDRVLVTPAAHRKHHSQSIAELNANYGTILSLWDRLLRTRLPSTSQEQIIMGLPGGAEAPRSLGQLFTMPFRTYTAPQRQ